MEQIILEKVIIFQMVMKFAAFSNTRIFITVFSLHSQCTFTLSQSNQATTLRPICLTGI